MNRIIATALSAGLALAAFSTSSLAGEDRLRLECGADSPDGLSSMDARLEQRLGARAREKFDASFEAAPGSGFEAGHVLQVSVGGAIVGTMVLERLVNGDIGGDLEFDTNIDRDEPDATVPFPANWPGVGAGTVVAVGTLDCSMQE